MEGYSTETLFSVFGDQTNFTPFDAKNHPVHSVHSVLIYLILHFSLKLFTAAKSCIFDFFMPK
jgi:hypothetical protein